MVTIDGQDYELDKIPEEVRSLIVLPVERRRS